MSKPLPDPPPPIWTQPAPGSRRPKLTREQIATAALGLADADGYDALSMRRVAEALGVGTMSLYYYVRNKDDLRALMEDALMGEILVPDADLARPWRDAMSAIARTSLDVFLRHPWVLFAPDEGRTGPNGIKHMEQSMAALRTSSLSDVEKFELITLVDDYVIGHALRLREPWVIAEDSDTGRALNQFITEQLEKGDFPELTRVFGNEAPTAVIRRLWESTENRTRFERGLRALLNGFDTDSSPQLR